MLSIFEISISGDTFLFLDSISSQQMEQLKGFSESFRRGEKGAGNPDSNEMLRRFCQEVRTKLGLALSPVAVTTVITLK